jgi:hypothetical protein
MMEDDLPTVVVIDDSAEVRFLIRTQLQLSGHFAVVADGVDGTDAVGLAVRHRPALLLLDISMPTMDGLDALPGIAAVSPDTRAVIYSGFGSAGLADNARALGAAAFIEKSLPIDQLPAALLAVLSVDPAPGPPLPEREVALVSDERVNDLGEFTSEDQSMLDEHLERFREVFDEAAIGMATMTLTGTVVRANRALANLMSCKRDDLIGFDYGRLTCGRGDQFDAVLRDISDRSINVAHLEHEVAGTSEPRRVLATFAPVLDSGGEPLYVFLQVQDITAQRVAEDELRRSEERFRLLVEAVEDYAIFMLSPEGVVVSWNAGAQRIKGYSAAEIIGRHFRVFYPQERQAEHHPEHELEMALRDGSYEEEGWRVRKDGNRFWANVLITTVFNELGAHIGFAKVTRDMTERRRAEQERDDVAADLATANASLELANARLERAAADQAQFLAVTAHELRTPAAVLGGSAGTLVTHWSDLSVDDRVDLLNSMVTSAGRLQRLLSDLLIASRLDAKALPLQLSATSMTALITGVVDTIRSTHPDAEFVVESEDSIEVLADADRLSQILENLLSNALQHGDPPAGITAVGRDGMATIRVTDHGTGVDPALWPNLFERFSTGDSRSGTGLGLFIARELARAHGGDLTYEPDSVDEPSGAFLLSLPLAYPGTRAVPRGR